MTDLREELRANAEAEVLDRLASGPVKLPDLMRKTDSPQLYFRAAYWRLRVAGVIDRDADGVVSKR